MDHPEHINAQLKEFGGLIQGLDREMLILMRALWLRDHYGTPNFDTVLQLIAKSCRARPCVRDSDDRTRGRTETIQPARE
jgi:hypothetical protein